MLESYLAELFVSSKNTQQAEEEINEVQIQMQSQRNCPAIPWIAIGLLIDIADFLIVPSDESWENKDTNDTDDKVQATASQEDIKDASSDNTNQTGHTSSAHSRKILLGHLADEAHGKEHNGRCQKG